MRPKLHPWVPLLRRPDGAVHVGMDPQTRRVLSGADADAVTAAAAVIDGRCRYEDWLQEPLVARGLVLLEESRSLLDADDSPVGWESLDVEVRQALNRSALTVSAATGNPRPHRTVAARAGVGVTVCGPRSLVDSVAAPLSLSGFTVRIRSQVQSADLGPADRVILIGRHSWSVVAGLMRDSIPHVAVSPRAASIRIGPFVEPGRSACLRCFHLARTDRYPSWPHISEHLDRLPLPEPDPALVTQAAGQIALLFAAWVEHPRSPVPNRIVEIHAPLGSMSERAIAVHPACGCTWLESPE